MNEEQLLKKFFFDKKKSHPINKKLPCQEIDSVMSSKEP